MWWGFTIFRKSGLIPDLNLIFLGSKIFWIQEQEGALCAPSCSLALALTLEAGRGVLPQAAAHAVQG